MDRFQIRISAGKVAETGIHLETDLQMLLGAVKIAEERFVASHVVMINGFFPQCGRSSQEKSFCLCRPAQFVQTKAGMEKTGGAIGGDATQLPTDHERAGPIVLSHQMMQAKLQDFGTILHRAFDRVQFRERLASHAEFCISAGGKNLMCEGHAVLAEQIPGPRGVARRRYGAN